VAGIILSVRMQRALSDVASNVRQALNQVVYAPTANCENMGDDVSAWIAHAWKAGAYTRQLLSST
jgi:hypothetical protein